MFAEFTANDLGYHGPHITYRLAPFRYRRGAAIVCCLRQVDETESPSISLLRKSYDPACERSELRT